jgi:type IV pilus assembly protein PilM
MASSDESFLVVNCGNTHVSAAVFSSDGDETLALESVQSIDLQYDFTDEESWLQALQIAVRQLKKESRLPGKGIFILPGNRILTKQLQVPHVEPAKQRQIIAVEAQQSVHQFGHLEWDSQVLHDDGIEADVLFLAAKKEDLKNFYGSMKSAGVVPTEITASSVLDYNTFLHTYPDFGEDCILLNIGARTANLLFATRDGFLARTINLGGNVLTQNLADALGISFEKAEQQKVDYCMGTLELAEDDPFVETMEVQRMKFLKRLNQELTRSMVAYRNQQKKQPPQYLLITGKGSLLYGLTEFLGESQNVEIHHLDPLANVSLDASISEEEVTMLYYELSESVGEAVRMAFPGRDGVGVNLLPSSIQRQVSMGRRKPAILVASLFLAFAPIYPFLQLHDYVGHYQQEVDKLDRASALAQRNAKKIKSNQEVCKQLNEQILKLEGLVNTKNNWIVFFSDIQANLQKVEDVWLEDLSLTRSEREETVPPQRRGEEEQVIIHKDYHVNLKGRLLLRNTSLVDVAPDAQPADPRNASVGSKLQEERILALADNIKKSKFVKEAKSTFSYEALARGFLDFEFDLTIDPEKPL